MAREIATIEDVTGDVVTLINQHLNGGWAQLSIVDQKVRIVASLPSGKQVRLIPERDHRTVFYVRKLLAEIDKLKALECKKAPDMPHNFLLNSIWFNIFKEFDIIAGITDGTIDDIKISYRSKSHRERIPAGGEWTQYDVYYQAEEKVEGGKIMIEVNQREVTHPTPGQSSRNYYIQAEFLASEGDKPSQRALNDKNVRACLAKIRAVVAENEKRLNAIEFRRVVDGLMGELTMNCSVDITFKAP